MSDERPDGPDGDTDPDAASSETADDGSLADTVDVEREPPDTSSGETGADDEAVSGDDETAHELAAYTTATRTLDPDVRWLWIGRSLVFAAIVAGVATAAVLAAAPGWLWVGPAVFGLAAVLGVGHSLLLYRSWSYEVREESLFLDRGVVTRVRTVVPYVRVQHVDTSRGPIERVVGLSSMVAYTAGSRGADVTIPGLTPEEADDLQNRLKVLAIESEGDDAV